MRGSINEEEQTRAYRPRQLVLPLGGKHRKTYKLISHKGELMDGQREGRAGEPFDRRGNLWSDYNTI